MESEAREAGRERRERGTGGMWQIGRIWWVQFYDASGRRRRESSHSDKKQVAESLLRHRLGQRDAGLLPGPRVNRVLVDELAENYLRDYRNNGRRGLPWAERCWKKHLQPFFGSMRAVSVSTDMIGRYVEQRKQGKAENATINRELACLRRMFSLGVRSTPPKVQRVPVFPGRLKENPPRAGFVEPAQYVKLETCCNELWLRAMLATAYSFGFRKSELLAMRVRQVDVTVGTLRLNPGTTKSGDGRLVKMTGPVLELVRACVLGKGPDDFVFTRSDGEPVKDFRGAWDKLVGAAELPGLLFHDLRRSAVRNMVRRGVPEVVAMRISGHKTRSVFDRYDIVSEADLAEAARRIEEGQNGASLVQVQQSEQQPVVIN